MFTGKPTFLIILCILTFMSCSMGIWNGISSASNPDIASGQTLEFVQTILDQLEDNPEIEELPEGIDEFAGEVEANYTAENIQKAGFASILAGLISLFGAYTMLQLKKQGYYIYLFGFAITCLAPMFIFGGLIGKGMMVMWLIIMALFAILYGLNLKHMN